MPLHTIVIQSHDSKNRYSIQGTKFYITYTLADILKFKEPHCARLLWFDGGNATIFLVLADFLKSQNVNGILLPYLGSSVTDAINSWIPLASNYIPQTGVITVIKASGKTHIGPASKFSLSIEIAPESSIYGAKSPTRF